MMRTGVPFRKPVAASQSSIHGHSPPTFYLFLPPTLLPKTTSPPSSPQFPSNHFLIYKYPIILKPSKSTEPQWHARRVPPNDGLSIHPPTYDRCRVRPSHAGSASCERRRTTLFVIREWIWESSFAFFILSEKRQTREEGTKSWKRKERGMGRRKGRNS
ncbi:hypothetical protein K469DRAFT_149037 [Zopfia rhizophila CBS 207.26]|uniref:Uncharacterized protein n=1 Tax=Zopfia rhizophila CBS 207.26 TaxID=1314779 RepID=A0A6A6E8Z1_9PEZI|nr:hypothetical protein K469DRAFT_149037 [Zopfia rhizophila CBS 207.26]